jgi:S1-C subfamily serine protease
MSKSDSELRYTAAPHLTQVIHVAQATGQNDGMKKLLTFVFWPSLAGLAFALALLQTPRLAAVIPGLAPYLLPPTAIQPPAPGMGFSYSDAISKAAPAVVSINFKQVVLTPSTNRNHSVIDDSNSLGSGVIISVDGFIISSYHIFFNPAIQESFTPDITVTFSDGRSTEARFMSLDEKNDLALLKVDADDLPYLPPADMGNLLVGDVVLAIGNPRNIGQSVTFGIISGLWQRDDSFMIQTDAAINPGNSGGALINIDGELIGINSTIVSESGGSEGISFAIPADRALNLLEQYLSSGPSGYLGVHSEILTLAEGLRRFGQDVQGFLVNEVTPNSPAEKAGMQENDVITGVNDTKLVIRDENDEAEAFRLIATISNLPPGELIMIEVFRDGSLLQLPAILGIGEPQVYKELEIMEDSSNTSGTTIENPPPAIQPLRQTN